MFGHEGRGYPSLIAIIRRDLFVVRRAPSAIPTKSHRRFHLCALHVLFPSILIVAAPWSWSSSSRNSTRRLRGVTHVGVRGVASGELLAVGLGDDGGGLLAA